MKAVQLNNTEFDLQYNGFEYTAIWGNSPVYSSSMCDSFAAFEIEFANAFKECTTRESAEVLEF